MEFGTLGKMVATGPKGSTSFPRVAQTTLGAPFGLVCFSFELVLTLVCDPCPRVDKFMFRLFGPTTCRNGSKRPNRQTLDPRIVWDMAAFSTRRRCKLNVDTSRCFEYVTGIALDGFRRKIGRNRIERQRGRLGEPILESSRPDIGSLQRVGVLAELRQGFANPRPNPSLQRYPSVRAAVLCCLPLPGPLRPAFTARGFSMCRVSNGERSTRLGRLAGVRQSAPRVAS